MMKSDCRHCVNPKHSLYPKMMRKVIHITVHQFQHFLSAKTNCVCLCQEEKSVFALADQKASGHTLILFVIIFSSSCSTSNMSFHASIYTLINCRCGCNFKLYSYILISQTCDMVLICNILNRFINEIPGDSAGISLGLYLFF